VRIDRDFTVDDPPARLAKLLDDVVGFYKRFVVLQSAHAYTASALWVLHTHVFEAADNTPYMHVNSPDAESGKSLFLEVSEVLVARPWYVDTPTEATVYRKIDADAPTMLFDEIDAVFNDPDDRQGMRALLNAGFRRGRKVPRCVGQGSKIEVKDFNVFCAKALAGLGRLPHTIETRKIPIDMVRKTGDEKVERWRLRLIRGGGRKAPESN
jgi:hypothetical protein